MKINAEKPSKEPRKTGALKLIAFGMAMVIILIGLFGYGSFKYLEVPKNRRHVRIILKYLMNKEVPFLRVVNNYVRSKFVTADVFYINIPFRGVKTIQQKRNKIMKRGYVTQSDREYVNGTLTFKGKEYNIKLRLKGDVLDHFNSKQWSYRIKVKKDALLGMKAFSIQSAYHRSFIYEWVFHHVLRKEGLLGLRIGFVNVVINGKNFGIYNYEEHFGKNVIENNHHREGFILAFDEIYIEDEFGPNE
ncbi:MAG: CotH kinase family protein, partial [Candidatus Margulisbacteria bacterium]|nr:CotH kinase family protein [Candidatus Margulisiibacteriota bacterium]